MAKSCIISYVKNLGIKYKSMEKKYIPVIIEAAKILPIEAQMEMLQDSVSQYLAKRETAEREEFISLCNSVLNALALLATTMSIHKEGEISFTKNLSNIIDNEMAMEEINNSLSNLGLKNKE